MFNVLIEYDWRRAQKPAFLMNIHSRMQQRMTGRLRWANTMLEGTQVLCPLMLCSSSSTFWLSLWLAFNHFSTSLENEFPIPVPNIFLGKKAFSSELLWPMPQGSEHQLVTFTGCAAVSEALWYIWLQGKNIYSIVSLLVMERQTILATILGRICLCGLTW